jgi:hypothetical protein
MITFSRILGIFPPTYYYLELAMALRMVNGRDVITLNDEFRKKLCGLENWPISEESLIPGTDITLRGTIYKEDLANTFVMNDIDVVNFRFRGQGMNYIQDGNVTGGIAKGDNGEVYIIHKGIINRPPRTSRHTWEREQNWLRENVILTSADRVEKERLYYVIGNLYDDNFRNDFVSFVRFCQKQKTDQYNNPDFGDIKDHEQEIEPE